jgi:peptidoglycan/xylan/chitin deacetylase (PgdA/CDA1 family)
MQINFEVQKIIHYHWSRAEMTHSSHMFYGLIVFLWMTFGSCNSQNHPDNSITAIDAGEKLKSKKAKTATSDTALRTTEQPMPAIVEEEDSTKKKIYLTFDDGPNPGTHVVLNILDKEEVPASFFVIGEHRYYGPREKRDWVRLQADNKFALCNHSYTHAWRNRFDTYYDHPEVVVADFQRCQDSLHFNNKISRTPGRNMWRLNTITGSDVQRNKLSVDSLGKAGFVMMGWDAEWRYTGKTQKLINDADYMLEHIKNLFASNKTRTPNHLVVLAHDRTFADAEDSTQLAIFIQGLKKYPEYEFRLATTYPGVDKPWIQPQ